MPISLDKVESTAPGLVSLAKTAKISLEKRNLFGTRAKVALVMDYSGSMSREYSSGRVQNLTERILALATQLDDDGAIDFFVFDSTAAHLGEVPLDNYTGAVNRLTEGRRMGTTDYAGAFRTVRDHFGFAPPKLVQQGGGEKKGLFGRKKKVEGAVDVALPDNLRPASEPVFAIFLTDGAPNSKPQAVQALIEVSTAPIFWKFLSIGAESFDFLQKLDDLEQRVIDNADYKPIGSIDALSDEALIDALLDEYAEYVTEAKRLGLLA
ncbi:VWA domain-containing protein [Nocardioides dongxiaopingii]|uniref:VWA domain-containing protein n=1 Tax=Nocardioides TaxID=1839 RepID=UPI0010C765BB|nr:MULTISPECIES: VWA domain-containing protein [Nocardioides]QCW50840.1 VWA domain-containing protein [Nocardioides sp. S-1144]